MIACGTEFVHHIAVPRGCLTETLALFEAHKIRPEVRDERYAGTAIEAEFQGQLRPFQEKAIAKITEHDEGILCAPTAFGKTAVAAWLIAERVNTLIVVHRQQLLDQWQERLRMFLDLPAKAIGHIGGGKMDRTGCVDVAVIQSLYRKDEVKDFVCRVRASDRRRMPSPLSLHVRTGDEAGQSQVCGWFDRYAPSVPRLMRQFSRS